MKYRAVVAARAAAKKALTDTTPVTRSLIPRIKRTPGAAPEPPPEPTEFPSQRKIVLASKPGTWTVSGTGTSDTVVYTDKTSTATTTSRRFSDGSCDDQRVLFAKKSDTISDLEPPPDAKELGVEWSLRLTLRGPASHVLLAMCANGSPNAVAGARPVKGVIVSSDITPASNKSLWPDMTKLMTDMLAVQLAAP